MADDSQQRQHAQSIATERFLTQQWGVPRNQVRQRLHDIAIDMAAQRNANQGQQQVANSAPAPFPKPAEIQTDTRSFDPKPLTLAIDPAAQNTGASAPTGGGFSGDITVCVSDGMGGFSTKTATFVSGLLSTVA